MGKEDALTIMVADYLRYQYPNVLWCHVANERQTSPMRGLKLKRMGVRKGIPDFLIFKSNDTSNGLAIELKIKPNKPTESQLEVLADLQKHGWATDVCYDFEQARDAIDNYLK